jgi:toxin ParE1/3/4
VPGIRWLPRALQDLERLHGFVARENPRAAKDAILKVIEATKRLERFPALGKLRKEQAQTRDLFVPFGHNAYVLRYRIGDEGEIVIVRVWHGREQR